MDLEVTRGCYCLTRFQQLAEGPLPGCVFAASRETLQSVAGRAGHQRFAGLGECPSAGRRLNVAGAARPLGANRSLTLRAGEACPRLRRRDGSGRLFGLAGQDFEQPANQGRVLLVQPGGERLGVALTAPDPMDRR